MAAGNADELSDIDFRVVVDDRIDKKELLTSLSVWPEVLFIETFAQNYVVLHFDCFVKADVFIYYQRELVASV